MLVINFNETYQLFYLKKSINELLENKVLCKTIIKSIKEDHLKGCNYINNIKIPLTFPIYILNYTNTLKKEKIYDYNFIGTINNNRMWIKKYNNNNSIIENSNYGRDILKKYEIDNKYYNILSKSKFTLTPTGDCNWSYRFFEAIMCLSIPILENNSCDIYMKDYYYFYDSDIHIYDKNKAIENYNKFVKSKHFLKNIDELQFI
jgi:hypothetical protein